MPGSPADWPEIVGSVAFAAPDEFVFVDPPDLVICDIARVDAEDVAGSWPDTPILGFTNHTDTRGLQRAHAAGFDQVIVKSALVERARAVVEELVGVDA